MVEHELPKLAVWVRFPSPAPYKMSTPIWLIVECSRCGEKIKVRINPDTDIDDYTLRKEILGNNCSNLMYAEINFDRDYKIINSTVFGGRLIT